MKDIKIFVICHKNSKVVSNKLLVPLQVGCALNGTRLENMLHDDEGENISNKNRKYCELTGLYYAWKNVEADYYGLFHYRRYLSFADKPFKTNIEGEVVCQGFDENSIKLFGWDEQTMRKVIEENDVVTSELCGCLNIYQQYKLPLTQNILDFDFCIDYVNKHFPDMKKAVKKYIHSSKGYFCNMFVMNKWLFNEYCQWLFEILDAHEKAFDEEFYDVQSYRVSGYLAERLTGIYLTYLKMQKGLKIKELQRVIIKNTDIESDEKLDQVCPVLINVNKSNFLSVAILLQSIIENINNASKYHIILNNKNLSPNQISLLRGISKPNVNYFVLKDKKLEQNINYPELCSRFGKYSKLLCLHGNCIVNGDIYSLFSKDFSSAITGGKDLNKIIKFGKKKLSKQARLIENGKFKTELEPSVLLVNLNVLKENLSNNQKVCSEFFDMSFNCMINQSLNMVQKVYAFAPHYINNEYQRARKNPIIINYQGKILPQNNTLSDMADIFWKYARSSRVYESLLNYLLLHRKRIKVSLYDKLFPQGTTRRLFTKTYIKKF